GIYLSPKFVREVFYIRPVASGSRMSIRGWRWLPLRLRLTVIGTNLPILATSLYKNGLQPFSLSTVLEVARPSVPRPPFRALVLGCTYKFASTRCRFGAV